MKYCEYCNEDYDDNLWKCPKCGQILSKKTPSKSKKGGATFAIILVIIMLFVVIRACSSSNKGSWGSDGYYNPTQEELEDAVQDAQDWLHDNW